MITLQIVFMGGDDTIPEIHRLMLERKMISAKKLLELLPPHGISLTMISRDNEFPKPGMSFEVTDDGFEFSQDGR